MWLFMIKIWPPDILKTCNIFLTASYGSVITGLLLACSNWPVTEPLAGLLLARSNRPVTGPSIFTCVHSENHRLTPSHLQLSHMPGWVLLIFCHFSLSVFGNYLKEMIIQESGFNWENIWVISEFRVSDWHFSFKYILKIAFDRGIYQK